MKLTIAIFKNEWGTIVPIEVGKDGKSWADDHSDYVRATESIEVDFPELSRDKIVEKQLESLEAKEKKARADFAVLLMNIEERRAQLLALPAPA